jgi:hypothetical protein
MFWGAMAPAAPDDKKSSRYALLTLIPTKVICNNDINFHDRKRDKLGTLKDHIDLLWLRKVKIISGQKGIKFTQFLMILFVQSFIRSEKIDIFL